MSSRIGGYVRQHHLALLCLFLVLGGGTAWALERNSVKSKHIVNEQIRGVDVADGSLGPADIADTASTTVHGGVDVAADACEDIVLPNSLPDDTTAVLVLPNRNEPNSDSDWDSRLILGGYGPRHAPTESIIGSPATPIRICNTSNENVMDARLSFYVLGFNP